MTRKLLLAFALLFVASAARAGDAVPDTIYNPNVSFPSYADVQSLKFLEPDYGFKEELHLGRSWNRLFEDHAVPREGEDAD